MRMSLLPSVDKVMVPFYRQYFPSQWIVWRGRKKSHFALLQYQMCHLSSIFAVEKMKKRIFLHLGTNGPWPSHNFSVFFKKKCCWLVLLAVSGRLIDHLATLETLNHLSYHRHVWCRCVHALSDCLSHETSSVNLAALMLQRREASSDTGCVSFAPHVNTQDHWQA